MRSVQHLCHQPLIFVVIWLPNIQRVRECSFVTLTEKSFLWKITSEFTWIVIVSIRYWLAQFARKASSVDIHFEGIWWWWVSWFSFFWTNLICQSFQHIEKHECNVCKQVFSQKALLENHIGTKHSDDLPYSCNFCTRIFPSKSARNNHQYMNHKNNSYESKHVCNECQISFEMKEELRIHSFIHFKGEIKTCLECYQIFKTSRLLNIHMEKHNTKKSFACTSCGDLFTFQTGLAKHIRMNRCKGPKSTEIRNEQAKNDEVEIAKNLLKQLSKNRKRTKPSKTSSIPSNSSEPSAPKKPREKKEVINSKPQDKMFRVSETVSNSLEVKVEVEVDINPVNLELKESRKIRKARNLDTSIALRPSRARLVYTCDFCGAKIKFKKKITEHLKNHHQNRYKCSECESAFKRHRQLVKHSIDVHGVEIQLNLFSCDVCDRKFDMKSKLETHKLSHDDNARNHICVTCNAAFKSVGNLHRHEATHVETKDFKCPDCPKSFKTKISLKVHKETVHVDVKVFVQCPECNLIVLETTLRNHIKNQHTEEGRDKPFKCIDCDKLFRSETVGLRHWSAVHDPKPRGVIYRCPDCPEQFIRQRDLKEHSFIHFDGAVFQCEVCQKKFTSKRLLNIHSAVHNEEIGRSFSCKVCDKVQFKTRGGLRKHMRNIHSNLQHVGVDAWSQRRCSPNFAIKFYLNTSFRLLPLTTVFVLVTFNKTFYFCEMNLNICLVSSIYT